MRDRLLGLLPWVLATLFLAALTHLVAILTLPKLATRDAYSRIAARGTPNRMVILPAPAAGMPLVPFRDPATVQGVCFYDLATEPARVRTSVEDGQLLTLSFRTQDGRIFYATSDRAALHGIIDVRLVNAAQLVAVEAGDDEEQGLPTELRLTSPTQRGMVVATALIARPGEREDAEARIASVDCHPEPIAP